MKAIPWAMIWLRAAMGPGIVYAAAHGCDGRWLGAIVLATLIDDILDGMVARRIGCATPALRRADSAADTVFYLGVAWAVWLREPQVMRQNALLLALLFALEAARYAFDLCKFHKAASYHSYLAKSWGLVLAAAVIGVLSFGGPRWLIGVAIALGIVVNAEGLAMSLMLPRWQNDVKTLRQALALRQQMLNQAAAKLI